MCLTNLDSSVLLDTVVQEHKHNPSTARTNTQYDDKHIMCLKGNSNDVKGLSDYINALEDALGTA